MLWRDYSLDTGRVVSVLVFKSFFLSLLNRNNYMNTTQHNIHTHTDFYIVSEVWGRDLSFCYRPCTPKAILFNKIAIEQLEQGRVENVNTEGRFCREWLWTQVFAWRASRLPKKSNQHQNLDRELRKVRSHRAPSANSHVQRSARICRALLIQQSAVKVRGKISSNNVWSW